MKFKVLLRKRGGARARAAAGVERGAANTMVGKLCIKYTVGARTRVSTSTSSSSCLRAERYASLSASTACSNHPLVRDRRLKLLARLRLQEGRCLLQLRRVLRAQLLQLR